MLRTAIKYRLHPTKAQETLLRQTLAICCDVYNSMVHWRKHDFEEYGKSPSYYDQKKSLSVWKQDHPELCKPNAQMLQNVAHRVQLAFAAFFRRCKDYDDHKAEGQIGRERKAPGYPRLKGIGQYNSLTYTGDRCYKVKDNRIWVSKIGDVKAVVHRLLPGKAKTCTVWVQAGKWFACVTCEVEAQPLAPSDKKVGIDVGLQHFAATNEGEFVPNPRFFRKDEKALAKAQRKADKLKAARTREHKVSLRKARRVVSRIHERIRNRRHDFVHQTSRKFINHYGLIVVEALNIKGMIKNHSLSKSISDAAWSMFRTVLTLKAESAARVVMAVDPAYTSQDCSECGHRAPKDLSVREHKYSHCGFELQRDVNAARNILKIGMGQHTVSG